MVTVKSSKDVSLAAIGANPKFFYPLICSLLPKMLITAFSVVTRRG